MGTSLTNFGWSCSRTLAWDSFWMYSPRVGSKQGLGKSKQVESHVQPALMFAFPSCSQPNQKHWDSPSVLLWAGCQDSHWASFGGSEAKSSPPPSETEMSWEQVWLVSMTGLKNPMICFFGLRILFCLGLVRWYIHLKTTSLNSSPWRTRPRYLGSTLSTQTSVKEGDLAVATSSFKHPLPCITQFHSPDPHQPFPCSSPFMSHNLPVLGFPFSLSHSGEAMNRRAGKQRYHSHTGKETVDYSQPPHVF